MPADPTDNCAQYRRGHPDFGADPITDEDEDSERLEAWLAHGETCRKCSDWELALRLSEDGIEVGDWPCVHMADSATFVCDEHPDLSDCPEALVVYEPVWDEFRLNTCGTEAASVTIHNCPWCGVNLPPSRYPDWVQELAAQGIDDPEAEDIPVAYQSDEWWSARIEH